MAGEGFKQFAQLDILKEIGRGPLRRFFEPFTPELTAKNLALPNPDASDTQYFRSVVSLLHSIDVLPERLVQALSAIGEMANPSGQEQLQTALRRAGLAVEADSPQDRLAMQIWLEAPDI